MKKSIIVLTVVLIFSLIPGISLPMYDNPLKRYETDYERFEEIEIGDRIVYFYQRNMGEAIVEKDFIVYQFDKDNEELLAKKTHWRDDLPRDLSQIMVAKEQAESMVEGEVQCSKLYIISPESDVYPIKPTPRNPCWIVRSISNSGLTVTIIDAVDGEILGYGIPPPYTAFSSSGPQFFEPCYGVWSDWYKNAEFWFNEMGYSAEAVYWPTEEKIRSHIQSNETAMFYEIAHSGGKSTQFKSGCSNGTGPEYTYATEIEAWIADYPKMPFTFLASCFAMCNTSDGTLSYEFRKGSTKDTVTVGYCNMSGEQCFLCWQYSIEWQDTMFNYMNQSYTVKNAFDQANADYPVCATANCMRFEGDETFKVVPMVKRVPNAHDVAVTNVTCSKTVVGKGFALNLNVCVTNEGSYPETFNLTTHANTTIIDAVTDITLTSGATTTISFTWNTTDFVKGNYTIWAYVTPVPSENDTADNILLANEKICVSIPGDVDGDKDVDIYDVVKITGVYLSENGDSEYKPNSDINGDGIIDIYDVVICTSHYRQSY